jgi:predicted metal-dependent phosphotriesterase family hydrolase
MSVMPRGRGGGGSPTKSPTEQDPLLLAAELQRFKRAGGGTVCDVTPLGLGRDVPRLRVASEESGVPIVTALGIYADSTCA